MARGHRESDVVVVGAGLAGLATARDVVAAGREVVVVEARDRVGGRTLNESTADGTPLEVGGQWIGPTQDRIAALARELEVATFPTWTTGSSVLHWDGRTQEHRGLPPLPKRVLLDIQQAHGRLDRMAATVPLERPWRAGRAEDWDGHTVETWLRRNVVTKSARDLLRLSVAAVFAAEPAELSLLHLLFYAHSGGGLERLLSTRDGAQESRFVGGSQLISERLAERLGDRVVLGAPVRSVRQDGDGVVVEADGHTVAGRVVVVTAPPALVQGIAFDPPLPADRAQLLQKMPMGAVIKVMAVYEEPFWRRAGLSGQATSDVGPVRVTFDNSPPDGTPGVLLGFVEGREARQLGAQPEPERRAAVLDCFARCFGDRARRPVEVLEKDWAADEWSAGCYGAHFVPGAWTQLGPALRRPHGRVHWAGTETAAVWNGYMDGAVRSGERAAAAVLTALARERERQEA